ncbi:unnamed protein product [Trichobilharzia regenti]|nr:unnamed protein product [Trichobilharzia regenti]
MCPVNPTTRNEQLQSHNKPQDNKDQRSQQNGQFSTVPMPLTTLDENQRNAKESLHLWLSETQLNQLLEYNFLDSYRAQAGQGKSIADLTWDTNHTQSYQSLCFWSDSILPQQTCCTFQMELGLLQRTTEELHQSLSNYLGRWHKQLSSLRTALRGNYELNAIFFVTISQYYYYKIKRTILYDSLV